MSSTDTSQHVRESSELGAFLQRLQRDIHVRDLRTGRWYTKLLTAYVEYYAQRTARRDLSAIAPEERGAQAQSLVNRAALWTAVAGTGAAGGVTLASVAIVQSAGLAAPVALPLAGAGIVGELLLRSVLHLQLACELAELYGMPFQPGGESELIRICALALRAEMHETEDDPGQGLMQRVVQLQEAGGLGKLIAAGMIGESLLRNAIPFADIAVSSVRNWQLAQQVGHFVQGYVSRRVALDRAVEKLADKSPESVPVLLEGVWFIFISDGRLTGIETALLAHLMREQDTSVELTERFVSDEAAWLEQLRALDSAPETRQLFLKALEVAASIELPVTAAEQTILKRAAETLGVPLTLAQTAEKLARAAVGSTALPGEHERAPRPAQRHSSAKSVRDRANDLARTTAFWAARTVQRLRPHAETTVPAAAGSS